MSVESAKAFCVCMMSDEDFRSAIGNAASAEAISDLMKAENYDFTQDELLRVIGELMGNSLTLSELKELLKEVYEDQVAEQGEAYTANLCAWLDSLA